MKKNVNIKVVALLMAAVLLVGLAIGGTFAWLSVKTEKVVNTFTKGDVDITLNETTGTEYKMIPGADIAKDPFITVKAGSENCYVFVKIEENLGAWTAFGTNFKSFLSYAVDSAWTLVPGQTNVYYTICSASNTDTVYPVLDGDHVTVTSAVTQAMMDALDTGAAPTLSFTGYAIQQTGFANA
ncbi:MAG: hypothetical protein IJT91_02905 [Clostridia bacterium]|nr:hypothetical protein [Clostridia bacterium]